MGIFLKKYVKILQILIMIKVKMKDCSTGEIIKYIENNKLMRQESLQGIEMSENELERQNNILLGVDMVIRWLKTIVVQD